MQSDDKVLAEKMLLLDIKRCQHNFKIHIFPQNKEENTDLQSCSIRWLLKEMQLEEDVTPILTKAYRIGALNNYKYKGTRDKIITILEKKFLKIGLCT